MKKLLLIALIASLGACTGAEKQEADLGADYVRSKIHTEGTVIVDVRPDEAYNGWRLREDVEGGHIPGAVSFSTGWLSELTDNQKIQLLEEKGIARDREVIIYSDYGKESLELYQTLTSLGYEKVRNYEGGMKEWSMKGYETAKMPNYSQLVYPEWLSELIRGGTPGNYDGRDYVVVNVNYETHDNYLEGHIPGAIYIDTNEIESLPLWNIVSDEKLTKLFKDTGITKDTMVVIYSEEPMAAGRFAEVLMYAGVEDIRVLNGGFTAWKRAGYESETRENPWIEGEDFGAEIPLNPHYTIDMEEAKALVENPNGRLAAVISWDEYIGRNNGGYTYFSEKGRIPGAVFGHGGRDAYHSEDFVDPDGTMRSYTEIEKMWRDWDIAPENRVAFYCSTGWRAGLALFDAYLMGWKDITVYDGGFYEWVQHPENEIGAGIPENK